MMDTRLTEYVTKDLSEAASLVCKGAKLLRLQQESDFFWFVFQNKSSCEELSNAYWNGELQVSAKSYSNTLKELKDRLFSRRDKKERGSHGS